MREGGREGEREGGREGGMAIMKWVYMAWKGCIVGNPSEARYNQPVNQYFLLRHILNNNKNNITLTIAYNYNISNIPGIITLRPN